MSRNRRAVPREQRVDELVAAATELLLEQGHVRTKMADVAKRAGVANAALYWYFPTKDHVLAEVWERALDAEVAHLAAHPPGPDPFAHLLQGLSDLRPYRGLHMSMHELLDAEPVMRVHDRMIAWVRGLALEGLAFHGHPEPAREEIAELVVVLFEGLNVPRVAARTAAEVIHGLLTAVLDVDPATLPPLPVKAP